MTERLTLSAKELQRFMNHVHPEPNSGCWLWMAACGSGGYALFSLRGKTRRASRIAYEHFNGPLGYFLACHACDTPACVNPAHIFAGSKKDNADDASRKHRLATGKRQGTHTKPWTVRRGELHRRAKLSVDAVKALRSAYESGETCRALAEKFGIFHTAVHKIVTRRNWKHVP